MGLLNFLAPAASLTGAALKGQQAGDAEKRQGLLAQISLAIKAKQDEEQAANRAATLANSTRRTDAIVNRPVRDPVKDHAANRDYDAAHPVAPAVPRAPVMGSPEWLKAQDALAAIHEKHRATPIDRTGKPESPEIAASRRDLKGFQSQQIRAEREASSLNSEKKSLIGRHFKADQPLANQKTAADSTASREYAALGGKASAAEGRVARLAHSADSTQSEINRMRNATPDVPPSAPAVVDHAAIVQRAQAENAGYLEAVQRIKANIADPAAQKAQLSALQRTYMQRMASVNAGREP